MLILRQHLPKPLPCPPQEPPKAAQLQFEANPQLVPPRRASLVIQVPELGATVVEAVVDLSAASPAILSWRQVCTLSGLADAPLLEVSQALLIACLCRGHLYR